MAAEIELQCPYCWEAYINVGTNIGLNTTGEEELIVKVLGVPQKWWQLISSNLEKVKSLKEKPQAFTQINSYVELR